MIAFVCFLLILLALGHATLALIGGRKRRPFCEWIAFALGLGISVSGMAFVLLSTAGIRPSTGVTIGLGVLAGGLAIWTADARPTWQRCAKAWPAWLILGTGFAVIVAYTLRFGNFEWDAYMLWGLKARIVAHAPLQEAHTMWNPHYSALHPNYPLHFPFVMAALYNFSGQVGDIVPKLIAPVYWIAMGMALIAGMKGRAERNALIVAWALMGPCVLRWGASGYADLPLAALHAGAILCLLRWMDTDDPRALRLLAIFATALLCTKNEGTPIVALLLFVIAAWTKWQSRSWRPLIEVICILGVFLLPWLLFRESLPVWDENYPGHFRTTRFQDNMVRIPVIVSGLASQTLLTSQWNGLWHVLIVLILVAPKRACQPRALVLSFLLIGQIAAYSMAYLIGPIDPADLLTTTGDRLLNHLVPLAVLLVGHQLSGHAVGDSVIRPTAD